MRGTYKGGVTTSQSYFPKDSTAEFDKQPDHRRLADRLLSGWDVSPIILASLAEFFAARDGEKR